MKGRPPKPTALLKLEKGKLYSDQRDRAALEPQPAREIRPRCPSRFSKEERKHWKAFAAILANYGLLSAANAAHLELLAATWTQYLECGRRIGEIGDLVTFGQKGYAENPWVTLQHKLGDRVDRYCQSLGLSSVAMAKLGSLMLAKRKEKDKFFDD